MLGVLRQTLVSGAWCPLQYQKFEKKSCITKLMQDLPLLSVEPGSCLRQKQNCRGYNIRSSIPALKNKTWMADVLLFIDMQTCTNIIISDDSWVLAEKPYLRSFFKLILPWVSCDFDFEQWELFSSDTLNTYKFQLAKSGHCYKGNFTWSCMIFFLIPK